MAIANPASGQISVNNQLLPAGDHVAIPIELDMTTVHEYDLDLSAQAAAGRIRGIQTLWVDNAQNGDVLEIANAQTRQTIRVPAGSQGFFPALYPDPLKLRITSSASNGPVKLILLNIPMPVACWNADGDPITGAVEILSDGDVVGPTNPLPVSDTETHDLLSGTLSITPYTIGKYETVAASQTNQVLGESGATGDYLAHLLIIPVTTSPGAVSITDGSGSTITVFAGGSFSVGSLVPFVALIGAISTNGAWSVTTGANVSVIGVGKFT